MTWRDTLKYIQPWTFYYEITDTQASPKSVLTNLSNEYDNEWNQWT